MDDPWQWIATDHSTFTDDPPAAGRGSSLDPTRLLAVPALTLPRASLVAHVGQQENDLVIQSAPAGGR